MNEINEFISYSTIRIMILLKFLDSITTYIGISIGYYEINPHMIYWINRIGLGYAVTLSFFIPLFIFIGGTFLIDTVIGKQLDKTIFSIVQLFMVVTTLKVIIDNFIVIIWGI